MCIHPFTHAHICPNKQTNISNTHQVIENPYWQEADQLAIYTEELNLG